MYKLLNSRGLGVSGRQNELIELALTHKFNGVEVDMVDLIGRHDTLGKEFACQFLQSAKIDLGTFELPIDFGASDADFNTACEKLDTIGDLAKTLGSTRCYVSIEPFSETNAFQENFEQHRERLQEVASKLKEFDVNIGLALQAAKANATEGTYKFIQTVEEILTLVKTVGHPNVGLCFDTWEWAVGGGAMDQFSELDVKTVTELRLADMSDSANPSSIKMSDRVAPGDGTDSLSLKVVNHLLDAGYDGSISVATDSGMFAGVPRNKMIAQLSKRLEDLYNREPINVEEEPEAPAEGEEAGEAVAATPAVAGKSG